MKCPNCAIDLLLTDRHGVEIDYCPRCRGVWLDRGELDKILERAAPDAPVLGRARDWARASDRDRPKHGRRKSFLREIFDFD
ncbi:MAG TPA: zf-TFIIB domain-containing protein [Candidatus Acidoferrales bacterium]|nr:zf-TFIIB domain-containing protein [Candidatus Acidoferrales bacterium]